MSFNAAYPFAINKLPPKINFKDPDLMSLIIKARAELGELKGYSYSMPNALLLLSPAIIKESLASSEIENINTTMLDVLQNQLIPEIEQREPDKEVLRYRDSILWGYKNLKSKKLSTRLISGIKDILMSRTTPTYRMAQNGIQNSVTKKIIYTPPVASNINDLLGNLENFMNDVSQDEMDPLIRAAISHYQFEAIHPFSDGNGRTGRILMVLQLVDYGILGLPILYISGYINRNKSKYYEVLLNVTKDGNWKDYLLFMLEGYFVQARETKNLLLEIMASYHKSRRELKTNHKNIYSADLVEALFSYPVITPAKLATELNVYRDTASRYLKELQKAEYLVEHKYSRYHFYANKELMRILHGV